MGCLTQQMASDIKMTLFISFELQQVSIAWLFPIIRWSWHTILAENKSSPWNFEVQSSCWWNLWFVMNFLVYRFVGVDVILVFGWVWFCFLGINKDERRHSRIKDLTSLPHPHWVSLCDCACIVMDKDHISHCFHPISESRPATGSRYASINDAHICYDLLVFSILRVGI